MQSRSLWIWVVLLCLAVVEQGRTETPEGLTQGLFAGQSVTLTLGTEEIAPFLQEKGFASGDTIKLTHKGHGRITIDRIDPAPPLTIAITATDYLSPREVAHFLSALGLQAAESVTSLIKGDTITAIVLPEGADSSALLGRRRFKTGDRVTVANIGERLKIERLAPGRPLTLNVSMSGFLRAEVLGEMAGAFGLSATTPEPAPDAVPVSIEVPNEVQMQEEVAAAQTEVEQSILEANEGKVVTAVDFRQLKALLPQTLAGLECVDTSGERMQMMGADMAMARAQYEKNGDSDTNIEIEITDMGNLSGFMRDGMVAWHGQSFNNETANGHVKTTEYQGYKGIEELDRARHFAMLQLYVAGRFLVSIEGEHVSMEAVQDAVDRIDLKQLKALAAASVTEAAPPATSNTAPSDAGVSDIETALEQMSQAGTGNAVDQDTLKSCLPTKAAGLKRTDLKGQQHTMSGVTMVMATGQYKGTAPGEILITIMDTAKMGPEMRMGMAPWSLINIDTETDAGYQKTTTFRKYRAYELLDQTRSETSITIFPGNRFYTSVTGTNVTMKKVRQALGQVNLRKLEALAAR
jgi:hypothetical protein